MSRYYIDIKALDHKANLAQKELATSIAFDVELVRLPYRNGLPPGYSLWRVYSNLRLPLSNRNKEELRNTARRIGEVLT
jgi:hypothetical protein